MADAIQDKNNPNIWRDGDITIIKIPGLGENAEMRFNFPTLKPEQRIELAGHVSPEDMTKANKAEVRALVGDNIKGPKPIIEVVQQNGFKALEGDRAETEKLLEEMFNHPKPAEKSLQHDFNQLIVNTYTNNKDASGKPVPLDVGKSNELTATEFGGALLEKKNGQPALGINLESMKKAEYIYIDNVNGKNVNKNHAASIVDIFRHELFHYVDTHMQGKANGATEELDGEARSVWYVNQFQAARGEPKRASYAVTNAPETLPSKFILPELLVEKMPKGDAPALNNLRAYTPIKSEDKEQKVQPQPQPQPQSSNDTQLLPGLASFATVSKLFLSARSELSPADQERVQSYVDSELVQRNAVGKDIAIAIYDSKSTEASNKNEQTLS